MLGGRSSKRQESQAERTDGRTGNSRSNLSPGALSSLEKGEQSFYVSAVWPLRRRRRYRECYLSLWAVVVVVGCSPRRLPSSFSPSPFFSFPFLPSLPVQSISISNFEGVIYLFIVLYSILELYQRTTDASGAVLQLILLLILP